MAEIGSSPVKGNGISGIGVCDEQAGGQSWVFRSFVGFWCDDLADDAGCWVAQRYIAVECFPVDRKGAQETMSRHVGRGKEGEKKRCGLHSVCGRISGRVLGQERPGWTRVDTHTQK